MAAGNAVRQRIRSRSPGLYAAGSRVLGPVTDLAARVIQAAEIARFRHTVRGGNPPTTRSSPRIVLDGCAFQQPFGGIARVWRAVMAEWSASGFASHVVVLDRGATAPRFEGFAYRHVPPVRAHHSASQRRLLEGICRGERADLFISTMYTHPTDAPSLLYVYDMTPEVLGWNLRAPLWREKRFAIDRTESLVCLSESTARDLERVYPRDSDAPCSVVLPGVDQAFVPSALEAVRAFRESLGLPPTYFMFLGHRDGYKNAQLLFDAVRGMDEDDSFGLLLVGGAPVPERGMATQPLGPVVHVPYLNDADLRAAYSGAAALLYLSRYEGFGLPILEALACGCPVIACRNSSLPEAAGPAALYVGEDDPDAVRSAMNRVRSDARGDLVAQGLEWARSFSWATTASGLERAIRDAAEVAGRG